MEALVFKGKDSEVLTSSLLVAKKFGKQHKDVMKGIKELLTSAQKCANLFVVAEYPDSYGRTQPMYIMNRDGFTLLAMGFTGGKALKFKLEYIEAFNEMEAALKIRIASYQIEDPILRAQQWIEEQKEKKRLQQENQETKLKLEQKAVQLDESKEWYSIKRFAKEHKMNWRDIKWRALKALSSEHGYKVKKIFDGNYGEVNIYHKDVFSLYFTGKI